MVLLVGEYMKGTRLTTQSLVVLQRTELKALASPLGFFGKRHLARHTKARPEGGLTRNHFNVNITPY